MKLAKKDSPKLTAVKRTYFISLLLVILMTMSLSACSSSGGSDVSDVSGSAASLDVQASYVKAFLDALCQEDYETYAEVCNVSVDDVKEDFPAYLESIIDDYVSYVPSDDMIQTFAEELKNLFAQCQYTVGPSTYESGSYTIPVTVQRFKVFQTALTKANEDYDKWCKNQPDDLDEDVATDQFFEYIIQYCDEEIKDPQYGKEKVITVTLSASESDNVYLYGENDLENLLFGLLDLSAWEDEEDED